MPEVPQASRGKSKMATAGKMNSGGVLLLKKSLKHNYLSVKKKIQKGKMTYLTDAERASFDRRNVKESKQWVTEIVLGEVFPVIRVSMAGK